jgi:ribosomal protein S18 acetylase RimI-like enzyme
LNEPLFEHDDSHLENPAYASLTGPHARFAIASGRALRYDSEVAPFVALPTHPTSGDWIDALELIPPGTSAALVNDGAPPPAPLKVARTFELVQMVGEDVQARADPRALTLSSSDVPEMLELVRATEPGPFFRRTIELGKYLGIREGGALTAMAGERMRFEGWTEVSAVCTAHSHRGQGLATSLVLALVADIRERAAEPFLHVLETNGNAIRLYEEIGFMVRRRRTISVVTRAAER